MLVYESQGLDYHITILDQGANTVFVVAQGSIDHIGIVERDQYKGLKPNLVKQLQIYFKELDRENNLQPSSKAPYK